MKLRFLPAEGAMPLQPFAHMLIGQPKRYLGRKFNPTTKEYEVGAPYECEDGSKEATRCKLFVSRGEAVPADKATAKAVGAEWFEPKEDKKPARRSGGSEVA